MHIPISMTYKHHFLLYCLLRASWVQFSHSVMSDSLQPHKLQPGLPVQHQLPELTQTHVHWVGDAIQPSHPLSSPSPPAPNPSEHQGLFQWVNSSHEVAKVLEFQLQPQSFKWTPRTDLCYFIFIFTLFTLQYCIGFALHWLESTTGVHAFPTPERCYGEAGGRGVHVWPMFLK